MEKLVTGRHVARVKGVKVRTVKTLREKGLIPFVMLGPKTIRYRLSAVEAALAKLEVKAVSARKGTQ
jgi:hypothetical protein